MNEDNKERKFKIIDKRLKEREEEPSPSARSGEENLLEQLSVKERFIVLVTSLMQSGLVYLGEIVDPIINEKKVNLNEVRNTISMIEMLKEKSKNNLDKEEQDYIDGILYTLKMKYVEKMKVK